MVQKWAKASLVELPPMITKLGPVKSHGFGPIVLLAHKFSNRKQGGYKVEY